MRWLQAFWGLEVVYFGPLEGPLSMDLQTPFLNLSTVEPLVQLCYVKFQLTLAAVNFNIGLLNNIFGTEQKYEVFLKL